MTNNFFHLPQQQQIGLIKAACIDRNIIIPRPTVDTLSPIRTFWEKATLIHVECHRTKIKNSPDRLFRHWYDLFVLNHPWVGEEALRSKDILDKVIRHKKAFYHSSYAHYDKCLQGLFCIIPENDSLESLEKDYRGMTNSGMFLNEPPAFPEIIAYLREFETKINEIFNPRNDPEQHRAKIPTKAEIS